MTPTVLPLLLGTPATPFTHHRHLPDTPRHIPSSSQSYCLLLSPSCHPTGCSNLGFSTPASSFLFFKACCQRTIYQGVLVTRRTLDTPSSPYLSPPLLMYFYFLLLLLLLILLYFTLFSSIRTNEVT